MIQAYIAVNGTYPTQANTCITSVSGCANTVGADNAVSAHFEANVATVGSLPRNVPTFETTRYGIRYQYTAGRLYDGEVAPARLVYYLLGTSQQCGVTGIYAADSNPANSSTNGYTQADSGGKTMCLVRIPGPAV